MEIIVDVHHEFWYKRGYKVFNFADDAFNMNKNRVIQICDEIEKRNLVIELNCSNGIRADKADRESLIKMKKAGFKRIAFGVEAGNNKILANIKKGETIEEIESAIKNACELNYSVSLFFLIGSPGETEEDVEDSFRLASKYPVEEVSFYNLIPFPNTELYDWVEKNGYLVLMPSEYLNGNMHWSNMPVFFTPELSIRQRKLIYRRGLKIGNRLRRNQLFLYYLKGFRKFGILSGSLAFFLSRNSVQYVLRTNPIYNKIRLMAKSRGWFKRAV